MNKDEMLAEIMVETGISKANIAYFYTQLVKVIRTTLVKEGECGLPGLGVLISKFRKARNGRNPHTGAKIRIRRKRTIRFRTYKALDQCLNPPAAIAAEEQVAGYRADGTAGQPNLSGNSRKSFDGGKGKL
jgi:DNA-binding protein HU-beta